MKDIIVVLSLLEVLTKMCACCVLSNIPHFSYFTKLYIYLHCKSIFYDCMDIFCLSFSLPSL